MNHYECLEISPIASPEVIRAAYRALAQRDHPDKHPGDAQAELRMKGINAAYAVLIDPERRRAYDTTLDHGSTAPPQEETRRGEGDRAAHRYTGEALGHAFSLCLIPAEIIANQLWSDTLDDAPLPRQQIGLRTEGGADLFIDLSGRHLPLALGQHVVAIAVQGGRLRSRPVWAALWNRNTERWYWCCDPQGTLGRAMRHRSAALLDVLMYALTVAALIYGTSTALLLMKHYWLFIPYLFFCLPLILGFTAPLKSRTAVRLSQAVGRRITAAIEALVESESARHA